MYKFKAVLLLILINVATVLFAQTKEEPIGAPIGEGKLTTLYSKRDRSKIIKLENLFIYQKGGAPGTIVKEWLNMMLINQRPNNQKAPGETVLAFGARSEPGCRFPNSLKYEMTFVADGKKMKIGSIFSFNEPESGGACTASIMVRMPYDTLVKVAKAKRSQLLIADLKIEFNETHLKAINKFLTAIS